MKNVKKTNQRNSAGTHGLSRMLYAIVLIVIIVIAAGAGVYYWWSTNQSKDIVETAKANGSFTTLVQAITAANLVDTLKGTGPFTVFAPTDAAFNALPPGLLNALLANTTALTQVLKYHVASGTLYASDVAGRTSVTTLQGGSLPISTVGGVKIGPAAIAQTNINCSNGVIHVIDTVLIPNGIMDIVQTAQYYKFSTLVTAVTTANLVTTLKGTGPFTVFAPTDAAFNALPSGLLNTLLANTTALTQVLTFHVASGRLMAADVVGRTSVTTLQGGSLSINTTGGVKIGPATITQTDIVCSNGVVHVIDTVLVPNGVMNIVQTAQYSKFSTLVTALQAANLVSTLNSTGPFTVFAPTDAAFNALPSGVLNSLLANTTALTQVLTYHVVSGELMASNVVSRNNVTTLQGGTLPINSTGGVKIGPANIIQTDIVCSNGVIHVIDKVLVPGKIMDIVQTAQYYGFSTLVTAVQTAGLVSTLNSTGPFTVFAPTNAAFAALPAGALSSLLANQTALTNVLTYHVVSGRLMAADVIMHTTLTTVQGGNLTITTTGGVKVNNANVMQADVECSNGVIHVIDAVLIPP